MKTNLSTRTPSEMKESKSPLVELVMSNYDDATGPEVGELLELLGRFATWHLDGNGPALNRAEFVEQLEIMLTNQACNAMDKSGAV